MLLSTINRRTAPIHLLIALWALAFVHAHAAPERVQMIEPSPAALPAPTNDLQYTLEDAINRALEANRGLANVADQVEGARL